MKLGKYSIYLLIYFFLNLNQSFSETISNIEIDDLDELPSTYEEEEFIDEDNTGQQILQKVKYKEPKLKIMGIESVRSSTPEWCRDKIRELIGVIINTDEVTVMKSILDYRDKFKTLSFDQIAFPRSVHGIEKYSSTKSIYTKGTPIQVRGVLLYNHLLRKHKLTKKYQSIREGEKIKFAYLKEPNPLQENVISVSTHLPKEFKLEKYIDYDLQFDKAFLQPIKNILDVIGWKTEEQGSLEAFFGPIN